MKTSAALFFVLAFFILTGNASAHETHIYKIGGRAYQVTVGSLNEPVAVDDNTGVDLAVIQAPMPGTSTHSPEAGAVTGLDQTLKVEIIAGDKKKVFDLRPKYGEPGRYTAKFYPTVQTTYVYRFFGTISDTPIDISFTCNPAGHPHVPEDKTEVEISEGVSRISKRGAFGCPVARADLGFPETLPSLYEMQKKISSLEGKTSSAVLPLALAILGIAAGVIIGRRLRKF